MAIEEPQARKNAATAPGYQQSTSVSSLSLQIDSVFSRSHWLVGFGLRKRKRLFPKERSCVQGNHGASLPAPPYQTEDGVADSCHSFFFIF